MSSSLRLQLDGALVQPRQLVVADESSIVYASGNGVVHVNLHAGRHVAIPSPAPGGISAMASSSTSRLLALADSSEQPSVHLYRSGAVVPSLTLPAVSDLTISAVAVSRDAQLVAAFGTAPSYSVEQWSTTTGESLRGSRAIQTQGLVTSASYCPANKDRLCASGPSGLYFFNSHKSFESTETKVVVVAAPPSPSASSTGTGEDASSAAYAVLESTAAAVLADEASAAVSKATALEAVRETASRRGANAWMCHSWLDADRVIACTAAGTVSVVSCSSGALQCTAQVGSLQEATRAGEEEAAGTRGLKGGVVIAYAVGVTGQGVLLGCSDGTVRCVKVVGGAGQEGWELHAVRVVAAKGVGAGVRSLAVMPGFDTAYVSCVDGSVHRLSLPLPPSPTQEAHVTCLASHHSTGVAGALLLPGLAEGTEGGFTAASVRTGGPLLSAGHDGTLRLWSSPTAPGTGLHAALSGGRALLAAASLPAGTGRITAVTVHRRLPVVALGSEDGRLLLFVAGTSGMRLVHEDTPHAGAVSILSFCSAPGMGDGKGGESGTLLASVSAGEGLLLLHDIGAIADQGGMAFAYARLPTGCGQPVCVAWSQAALWVGTSTGHIASLSLSLPLSRARGVHAMDESSCVAVHGVFPAAGGVTALACIAVGAGDVLMVGCGRGGDLLSLPVRALTARAVDFDLSQSCGAPLALPSPYGAPVTSLQLSPAACTGESSLLAAGSADGAVSVLHITVPPTSSSPSCNAASFLLLHAGPTATGCAGLHWAAMGGALVSVGAGDTGSIAMVSLAGDGAFASRGAEAGQGLPKGSLGLGTPLSVEEGACLASLAQASPSTTIGPRLCVVERVARAAEAAVASEHASVKAGLVAQVDKFRAQVRALLEANDSAAPLEKLPRTDFTLDSAGREAMEAAFEAGVQNRMRAYAAECAALDAAMARIRTSCVDCLESLPAEVRAVHSETAVRNFAVPKRVGEEARDLAQLALLRSVELGALAVDPSLPATSTATGAGKAVWAALTSSIPADSDWVVHVGALAATTDPAGQLEALLAGKAGAGQAGGAGKAAAAGAGEGGDAGAGAGAEDGYGGKAGTEGEGGGEVAWEGEAVTALLYHPAAVRTAAQKRAQCAFLRELLRATRLRFNATFAKLSTEKSELIEAVRTRHARIKSILDDLGVPALHTRAGDVRQAHMAAYSAGFPEAAVLVAAGLTVEGAALPPLPPFSAASVAAVSAAAALAAAARASAPPLPNNNLAGAVTADALPLGPTPVVGRGCVPVGPVPAEGAPGVLTLTDPFCSLSEEPARALGLAVKGKAPDASLASLELMMTPFVSEAEKKRKSDEEARAAVANASKDDAPERALVDMFNGQLQSKDEITALAEALALHRTACPWLDITGKEYMAADHPDITPEQKTEWEKYKKAAANLEDEKAKVRNALLAEIVKLTAEARDMVEAFDAKVASASKSRAVTATCATAVELLCSRLACSIDRRESALARDAGLDALYTHRLPSEASSAVDHESFLPHEAAALAAVDAAKEVDRALDRGLRETLMHANGDAPFDSDVWKVLQALVKKRTLPPPPLPSIAPPADGPAESGDPWAWADAVAQTPAERASVVREASLRPLSEADIPEGYSAILESPGLWAGLQRARAAKIEAEIRVTEAAKWLEEARSHRAVLAGAYTAHKDALDGYAAEREACAARLSVEQADAELLIRLKAGQDEACPLRFDGTPHPLGGEVDSQEVMADALFVGGDVVEAVNGDVRRLGGASVDTLQAIRDFRKGLLLLGWEFGYARAARSDARATQKDLTIMRAAGVVKEYVMGVNVAAKARDEVVKAEAKLEHAHRSHGRNMAHLLKSSTKLETSVRERAAETTALESQVHELSESVGLREVIVKSRKGTLAVPGQGQGQTVAVNPTGVPFSLRAKLLFTAKAQAAEMEALREEIARLNLRNFPAFPEGKAGH